jgi:hypothetical protein
MGMRSERETQADESERQRLMREGGEREREAG